MKATIIDLYNPLSAKPGDALLPYPGVTNGRRLIELIQILNPRFTDDDFLDTFGRRALWPGQVMPTGPTASLLLAREARRLRRELLQQDANIVTLGLKVWSYFTRRERPQWFTHQRLHGARIFCLPHPSTRSLFLNDQTQRIAASRVLNSIIEHPARPLFVIK